MRSKILSLVGAVVLGLSLAARAADKPASIELDWTYGIGQTVSSAGSSTTTVPTNAVGFNYCVNGVGAAVSFTVHQDTRAYSSDTGYSVARASSTLITIPSGASFCDKFLALTLNPSLIVHGFTTSATHYITVSYGERYVK